MNNVIAFNTANLVAMFTDWSFSLGDWGKQDELTAERFTEEHLHDVCAKAKDAGYSAIELWRAFVDPDRTDDARAARFREVIDSHGLDIVALGGPMDDGHARVARAMKINRVCGMYYSTSREAAGKLSADTGIEFCMENHPEPSARQIRENIPGGCGAVLDLGWLGTQGLDAPAVVRELGDLVWHVHVKDVAAAGGHHTVPLGTGAVDVEGVLAELKRMNFAGPLSWEDEPEDRNPWLIAGEMREWIARRIA